jgi:hypothetical protein
MNPLEAFRQDIEDGLDFLSHRLQLEIPQSKPEDLKTHPLKKAFYNCVCQLNNWPPRDGSDYINDVIFLLALVADIKIVELAGWDIEKLKNTKEFSSRAYEITIGADYLANDYKVTSPDPPDFVINSTGGTVHGECKRKQPVSERDKRVSLLWDQLEEFTINVMEDFNKFYGVTFKSQLDPDEQTIDIFKKAISAALFKDIVGFIEVGNNNHIFCTMLANPGDIFITDQIEFGINEPVDKVYMSAQMTKLKDGRLEWKKPRFIAFKSADKTDKVKTVLNSLKKSVRSLRTAKRECVPGIAHVEIHKHGDDLNHGEYLKALIQEISHILNGRKNTRLNCVVLTWHEPIFRDGVLIAYQINKREISHTNPEHPFPSDFESYRGRTILLRRKIT